MAYETSSLTYHMVVSYFTTFIVTAAGMCKSCVIETMRILNEKMFQTESKKV